MKSFLSGAILVALVLCLGSAVTLFGGILLEHALPLYLITAVLLLLWAGKLLLCREVSWGRSPVHLPVLLFAGYALVWYFVSPIEYESRLELLQVGVYAAVYFLAASNLYRVRDRTIIVFALTILAFGQTFYALTQFVGRTNHVLWLDRADLYTGRGSGTYFCPNHLAGFLEMVLGLLTARLLIYRKSDSLERNAVQKIVETYAVIFLFVGLFSTLSRGGWLATGVALLALLLWAEWARVLPSRMAISVFVGLILVGLFALNVPAIHRRVEQSLTTRLDIDTLLGGSELASGGLTGREPMWKATRQMIRDHPWFGTGPGTWEWIHLKYRDPELQIRPRYAHNDVLHLTSDYGVVGLLLVVACLLLFFRQVVIISRRSESIEQRAFAMGCATGILALLVHSFVDFNLHIPGNALLFVTLLGLTVAVGHGTEDDQRIILKPTLRVPLGLAVLAVAGLLGWTGITMSLASQSTARGYDASQEFEWARAMELFQRALQFDSKSPATYAQIGDVYRMQSAQMEDPSEADDRKDYAEKAVAAYAHSLVLNPYQSEVMLRQAAAYELAADNTGALAAYKRALAVDPNNAFNYLQLGVFYKDIGDKTHAIEALERSAALNNIEPIAQEYLKELQAQ